jgi:sRNA-binding carbon storage regulator CsrA
MIVEAEKKDAKDRRWLVLKRSVGEAVDVAGTRITLVASAPGWVTLAILHRLRERERVEFAGVPSFVRLKSTRAGEAVLEQVVGLRYGERIPLGDAIVRGTHSHGTTAKILIHAPPSVCVLRAELNQEIGDQGDAA